MTGLWLYLIAVALWIVGSIAWGVYFSWGTDDTLALAFMGGVFLPLALFFLAVAGLATVARQGVDRLNMTVQRRRAQREAIEREIAEWLRQ